MDLYCTIYVYARVSFDELLQRLAAVVDGTVTLRTVESSDLVLDVLQNDEFNEELSAGGAGDFVFFPYFLEVEAVGSDADSATFLREVAKVLSGLGMEGFDFVTAADFEEELPGMGRSRPGPLPSR